MKSKELTIELIYDPYCPNIEDARINLTHALSRMGIPARLKEWNREDSPSPPHVRYYGSPTILINGKNIAGENHLKNSSCCGLHTASDDEIGSAPSVGMIKTALRNSLASKPSNSKEGEKGWLNYLAVLLGIGTSLIPVGACPICLSAYASLLGSVGFSFLLKADYILPITVILLIITVAALGYGAKNRRRYGPLFLGTLASLIILESKFS